MKPLSMLARKILDYCRTRRFKISHVLSRNVAFQNGFVIHLNPREQAEIDQTFEELVQRGAFRRERDRLVLTEVGFDLLYPVS
jgi:hypothetical protein